MSDDPTTTPPPPEDDQGHTTAFPPVPPSPPPTTEPVVVAPLDQTPRACPECHAGLEPDQLYCLVCGAPSPQAPALRGRGSSVGMWIAAALTVFAIGAGALAWALSRDDPPPPDTAVAVTGTAGLPMTLPTTVGALPPDTTGQPPTPTPTITPVPTSGTVIETVTGPPTATSPPFPTAAPTDTTSLPPDTTDPVVTDPATTDSGTTVTSDWPTGTSAWTVVLASATDPAAATARRDEASGRGYQPGILMSSDHAGLRPGYYVVYDGRFSSRAAVLRHVKQVRADYPGAYPRYIRS